MAWQHMPRHPYTRLSPPHEATEASIAGLPSGELVMSLRTIPGSASLVLFWNDAPYEPDHHERTPLAAARSDDGGRSWRRLGNLRHEPGAGFSNLAAPSSPMATPCSAIGRPRLSARHSATARCTAFPPPGSPAARLSPRRERCARINYHESRTLAPETNLEVRSSDWSLAAGRRCPLTVGCSGVTS